MSENYCSHLENKLLSAKAWQRYVFFKSILSMQFSTENMTDGLLK